MVRQSLQPQISLMAHLLASNKPDWDVEQCLRDKLGQGRRFRMQDVFASTLPSGHYQQYLRDSRALLEQEVWSHLSQTERIASDAFRYVARGSAVQRCCLACCKGTARSTPCLSIMRSTSVVWIHSAECFCRNFLLGSCFSAQRLGPY